MESYTLKEENPVIKIIIDVFLVIWAIINLFPIYFMFTFSLKSNEEIFGENIPEEARIICLADSYDAMTSKRSYSSPRSQEEVRAEIERCSGTQFDPEIAKYLIQMIDEDEKYLLRQMD